jgi:hypothetical protein
MTGADTSCQSWWLTIFICLYSVTGFGFMRMFLMSYLSFYIGGLASHLLNLGSGWKWLVGFMHWLLYPRYLLDRWLGGVNSQIRCFTEWRSVFPMLEIEPEFLSFPAHTLVILIKVNR